MQRRSRAVYRAFMRLFPPAFRREFGRDMEGLFLDKLAEARGSARATAGLWLAAARDAVFGASAEWVRHLTRAFAGSSHRGGIEGWLQDVRTGVRALRRRPAFTATAAGTLALGMAAVVAMFSVVDGVLLRPLPYPGSERITVIWKENQRQGSRSRSVDHPDVRAWNAVADDFTVVGYADSRPTLSGFGPARVISAVRVTGGLLGVFGLEPELGRDLDVADDVPDGPRVAVVSHGFWQNALGGDSDVLGSVLTLNGEPWQVVGVAPAEFDFPTGTAVWLPRRHQAEGCDHGCNVMAAVARLPAAPHTRERVLDGLAVVDARLARDFPDEHADVVTELQSLHEYEVADVENALWILFAAVGMVLLIACANVANLLLIRAQERADETALRATLGASRGRLVRQFLTEALLLTLASGTVALVLAWWALSALPALAPEALPRLDIVGLDLRAVVLSGGLVLIVTAGFGLLPALRSSDASVASGRRSVGRRQTTRSRSLLLATEVALSLTLLLGAGLLLRTLQEMRAVDLGYAPEQVERFRLSTPSSRYDTRATLQLFAEIDRRLAALPGVEAVGHGFGVPFAAGSMNTDITLVDRPERQSEDFGADVRPSSPGYLEAMGMRLIEGRWIDEADTRAGEAVAVINEAAAHAYYPDESPLGRRVSLSFSWGFDDEPDRTVVGVVGDIRARSLTEPDPPTAYLPNEQAGFDVVYFTMLRTRGAPSVLAAARAVIAELDPELAVTLEEAVSEAVARESADARFFLGLLAAFAGLALLLAGVGLYGVVAYAVGRRRREIGVRRALGAGRSNVLGLVVRQGMAPALAGVVIGLAASWTLSRFMATLLYGVSPQDPITLASATALLLGVVLLATVLPARRASRISPVEALRAE
jgi:predicted permease